VPEYSRIYQEEKGRLLTIDDVIPIAIGQIQLEDMAKATANHLLICDTDILETKVYSQAYNGSCPQWLLDIIPHRLAHLYLLADIDMPWEPDGIRDRPYNREEMHDLFKNELIQQNLPFAEISGSYNERLKQAVCATDEFLNKIANF
jgi:nicotinamide riboside kinase